MTHARTDAFDAFFNSLNRKNNKQTKHDSLRNVNHSYFGLKMTLMEQNGRKKLSSSISLHFALPTKTVGVTL